MVPNHVQICERLLGETNSVWWRCTTCGEAETGLYKPQQPSKVLEWKGVCNVIPQTLKEDPSALRDPIVTLKGVKSTQRIGWAHLGFRWEIDWDEHHRYGKWIPWPQGTPRQLQRVPNIYVDLAWLGLRWSLPWAEWSIYIALSLQCILNLRAQRCKHLLNSRTGLEKLDMPEDGFPSLGLEAF